MKRISFVCLLILLCSLPGKAQFWIDFGWNEPHCQGCLWMEQALRLNGEQAAYYHNTVHKYGQKIEKEARKHYRYWDQSAKKIFNLRMERDQKLQRILSPSQFRLYVRFVRESPQRIHDYVGWFNNPQYPDYHPTDICRRYEDHYWHCRWEYSGSGQWNGLFDDGKWYPGKYDHPQPQARPNQSRPHQDNGQWKPGKYERQGRPAQIRKEKPDTKRPGANRSGANNRRRTTAADRKQDK